MNTFWKLFSKKTKLCATLLCMSLFFALSCGDTDKSTKEEDKIKLSEPNISYRDTLCALLKSWNYIDVRRIAWTMPDKENASDYSEWIIALDSIRKIIWPSAHRYVNLARGAVVPYYQKLISDKFGSGNSTFTYRLEGLGNLVLNKSEIEKEMKILDSSKHFPKYIFTNANVLNNFLDTYSYGIDAVIEQFQMKNMNKQQQMALLLRFLSYVSYKHDVAWGEYMDSLKKLTINYNRLKGVKESEYEWVNQYTLPPSLVLLDIGGDCDKKSMLAYGILRKLWWHVAYASLPSHVMLFFSDAEYAKTTRSNDNWLDRNGVHYLPFESTNSNFVPGKDRINFDEIEYIFAVDGKFYQKSKPTEKACTVCDFL